jgi:hypothetical protein
LSAVNVGNPLSRALTSMITGEFTVGKVLMNAENVESPLPSTPIS